MRKSYICAGGVQLVFLLFYPHFIFKNVNLFEKM